MKFRKVALLFGAVLLSGTFLVACGNQGQGTGEEEPATEDQAEEEPADDEEAANGADAVTGATSMVGNTQEAIIEGMSAEGAWVFGLTGDIDSAEEINVDGNMHYSNDETADYMRKIALYENDADRNLVGLFSLTAPRINVNADNTNFVGGELDGEVAVVTSDIYVNAPGFTLDGVQIDGNVIFSSEEFKESATLDLNGSNVTGEISVAAE